MGNAEVGRTANAYFFVPAATLYFLLVLKRRRQFLHSVTYIGGREYSNPFSAEIKFCDST